MNLEKGKQNLLKLHKDQKKYFAFQKDNDEPFKIISISKFGDVKMYLNISSLNIQKKEFSEA